LIWHRPGASLRGTFSERYVARPISEAAVEAHLAPMRQKPHTRGRRRRKNHGNHLQEEVLRRQIEPEGG
jgi:hypothetical protein